MNKLKTTRRSFLISSGAGLTSLVFADSAISAGEEAVDLLNNKPTSPPTKFFSICLVQGQWKNNRPHI